MNKDRLSALIIFIAGSAVSIFLNKSLEIALTILGTTVVLTLLIIFNHQIHNVIRCYLPLCRRNVFKKQTIKKGVLGRDELLKELLWWHNSNQCNKVALISGAAGSGKTTLAWALKDSVISSESVIVVSKNDPFYNNHNTLMDCKSNSIIVFDYVLESFERIRNYVNELMNSSTGKRVKKQKISIILLERDIAASSIIRFIGVEQDNVLQLNLDDYTLSRHTLTEIVKHKIRYEEDENAVRRDIDDKAALQITRIITEQLDKKLCRPIFASVLATIYRRNESFDYNVKTKDEVFLEYWKSVTGFRKFLPDKLDANGSILNYVTSLMCNVKIISIFATITALDILCYQEGNEFRINFSDSNSGKEVFVSPSLSALVREAFYSSRAPSNNLITWLRYLYQHNSVPNEAPIGIVIHPMMQDLFSSWMLLRAMTEDKNLLSNWFAMVSQEDNGKYIHHAYNFIIRAAEDFGNELFEWFSEINLPDEVLVSQWENIFTTDINYVLDVKSDSTLQGKYDFFVKHYQRLREVLGDSENFNRLTQNIIDMVNNRGKNGHSEEGLKLLREWCEQQKQSLDERRRTLK